MLSLLRAIHLEYICIKKDWPGFYRFLILINFVYLLLYNNILIGLSFRFATAKYKPPTNNNNTENSYMHLTNYAVNKFSRDYVVDDESGSKR